ncbi:hypothetical protein SDC9_57958 [bioreactor metagenome]|uniref:Uncharacterized protein n=1 Tax=bioreactor metagenome TaxID=1076179 RepID=A0A644X622_9ZZZZ
MTQIIIALDLLWIFPGDVYAGIAVLKNQIKSPCCSLRRKFLCQILISFGSLFPGSFIVSVINFLRDKHYPVRKKVGEHIVVFPMKFQRVKNQKLSVFLYKAKLVRIDRWSRHLRICFLYGNACAK